MPNGEVCEAGLNVGRVLFPVSFPMGWAGTMLLLGFSRELSVKRLEDELPGGLSGNSKLQRLPSPSLWLQAVKVVKVKIGKTSLRMFPDSLGVNNWANNRGLRIVG